MSEKRDREESGVRVRRDGERSGRREGGTVRREGEQIQEGE